VDRHARLNRIGRTKVNSAQKKTPARFVQAGLDMAASCMHDRSSSGASLQTSATYLLLLVLPAAQDMRDLTKLM
jgi:hypothetical protein